MDATTGEEASKALAKLLMNEQVQLDDNTHVRRVPGGWIFYINQQIIEGTDEVANIGSSCFVAKPGNNTHNW